MKKSQEQKNQEFIVKAKLKHGDKYDYSKVQYKKSSIKVCIICPEHGEFWQRPNDHLSGCGCPSCARNKRINKEEFLKRANKIHNNKYSYNLENYKSSSSRITIICPIHGEFKQVVANHLQGNGCPYCAGNIKKSTSEFINQAQKIHNQKYDYSKVQYINDTSKVCIICPKHGEFWQKAGHHLEGHGCPKCGYEKMSSNNVKSQEEFIKQASSIHCNKYIYDKVQYLGSFQKIIITCPIHGDFEQTPASHLSGCGCPRCSTSKGENRIQNFLDSHNIEYIKQYSIPSKVNKSGYIYADFYIPSQNVIIEYNGVQHYKPIKHFGGKEKFNIQIDKDIELKKYCKAHNINLLEIYYEESLIEKVLQEYLETS